MNEINLTETKETIKSQVLNLVYIISLVSFSNWENKTTSKQIGMVCFYYQRVPDKQHYENIIMIIEKIKGDEKWWNKNKNLSNFN